MNDCLERPATLTVTIPRVYAREMPITRRTPKAKRPKRKAGTCHACTLSGPRLFHSLFPHHDYPTPIHHPWPMMRRWIIGPHAYSAPTKSEARAGVKARHGPIPPGTECYLWTH